MVAPQRNYGFLFLPLFETCKRSSLFYFLDFRDDIRLPLAQRDVKVDLPYPLFQISIRIEELTLLPSLFILPLVVFSLLKGVGRLLFFRVRTEGCNCRFFLRFPGYSPLPAISPPIPVSTLFFQIKFVFLKTSPVVRGGFRLSVSF